MDIARSRAFLKIGSGLFGWIQVAEADRGSGMLSFRQGPDQATVRGDQWPLHAFSQSQTEGAHLISKGWHALMIAHILMPGNLSPQSLSMIARGWQLPTTLHSDINSHTLLRHDVAERIYSRSRCEEIAYPHGEQVGVSPGLAPQLECGDGSICTFWSIFWYDGEDVEVAVALEITARPAPEEPNFNCRHLSPA